MKHSGSGLKTKVASAVKFFFVGDEESFYKAPSFTKELSLPDLDMVTGGNRAAVDKELIHQIELLNS